MNERLPSRELFSVAPVEIELSSIDRTAMHSYVNHLAIYHALSQLKVPDDIELDEIPKHPLHTDPTYTQISGCQILTPIERDRGIFIYNDAFACFRQEFISDGIYNKLVRFQEEDKVSSVNLFLGPVYVENGKTVVLFEDRLKSSIPPFDTDDLEETQKLQVYGFIFDPSETRTDYQCLTAKYAETEIVPMELERRLVRKLTEIIKENRNI